MAIKIDKNIPLPLRNVHPITDTLQAMEIGDSFIMPGTGKPANKQSRAHQFAKPLKPKRFVSRRVEENNKTIVRVWRVEDYQSPS